MKVFICLVLVIALAAVVFGLSVWLGQGQGQDFKEHLQQQESLRQKGEP